LRNNTIFCKIFYQETNIIKSSKYEFKNFKTIRKLSNNLNSYNFAKQMIFVYFFIEVRLATAYSENPNLFLNIEFIYEKLETKGQDN